MGLAIEMTDRLPVVTDWRRPPAAQRPSTVDRCAAGFVMACLIVLALPIAHAREAVTWIESYDEALEEARRTGKPIFLEFRCAP